MMKDAEKIINALKVFDGNAAILYDSATNETVTFQDVVDFVAEHQAEIERLTEGYFKLMDEHDEYGNLALERLCEIEELQAKNADLQKQVDELKGMICEYVADKCKLFVKVRQAVKDTAKEILTKLADDFTVDGMDIEYPLNRVKIYAKRYGVEVE